VLASPLPRSFLRALGHLPVHLDPLEETGKGRHRPYARIVLDEKFWPQQGAQDTMAPCVVIGRIGCGTRCGQNGTEIALGRKNWLFAGSDSGGERAAAIYSLIPTLPGSDDKLLIWLASGDGLLATW
jgi:hypothetical protein